MSQSVPQRILIGCYPGPDDLFIVLSRNRFRSGSSLGDTHWVNRQIHSSFFIFFVAIGSAADPHWVPRWTMGQTPECRNRFRSGSSLDLAERVCQAVAIGSAADPHWVLFALPLNPAIKESQSVPQRILIGCHLRFTVVYWQVAIGSAADPHWVSVFDFWSAAGAVAIGSAADPHWVVSVSQGRLCCVAIGSAADPHWVAGALDEYISGSESQSVPQRILIGCLWWFFLSQ